MRRRARLRGLHRRDPAPQIATLYAGDPQPRGRAPRSSSVGYPRSSTARSATRHLVLPGRGVPADGERDLRNGGRRRRRRAGFREDNPDSRMDRARGRSTARADRVSWGLRESEHARRCGRQRLGARDEPAADRRHRARHRRVRSPRSRADALAWCVRLVGQHEGDWLAELREAMTTVDDVRPQGSGRLRAVSRPRRSAARRTSADPPATGTVTGVGREQVARSDRAVTRAVHVGRTASVPTPGSAGGCGRARPGARLSDHAGRQAR